MTGSFISSNVYNHKYSINAIRIYLRIWNKNDQNPEMYMVFSKDYFCILNDVYHNRKIDINFCEKMSEETVVYSIDQM